MAKSDCHECDILQDEPKEGEKVNSKCGCLSIGKKPNPECFSAACEFCQFCGACNASIKYEKIRFCDVVCEQAWKLDEPNA